MKNLSKQGFTLIELMIVVVILGVLMSTIVPKLVGAQARGRDTGRKADLRNIETVLATYFSDHGEYPTATGECLGGATAKALATSATNRLKGYLKGGKMVKDPSLGSNTKLCPTETGTYYYKSLSKNSMADNGYLLCADMEIPMNANTVKQAATAAAIAATTFKDPAATMATTSQLDIAATTSAAMMLTVDQATGDHMLVKELPAAGNSLYCVVM